MLKASSKTTVKDYGADEIVEAIKEVDGAVIDVGLFEGDKHKDSELTLPQIGAVNEYGSPTARIPPRPWLGRAVRERRTRWEVRKADTLDDIQMRKTNPFSALLALGEKMASDVRETIDAVTTPPKAESTIKSQGGKTTHPLIWLGILRASVRARVQLLGRTKETKKGKPGAAA